MEGVETRAAGRRWPAAPADAVGVILVADAALSLLAGRSGIAPVFFHIPGPAFLQWLAPAVFGAGILLRLRPVIVAAAAVAVANAFDYAVLCQAGRVAGPPVAFSLLVAGAAALAVRYRRRAPAPAVAAAAGLLLLAHLATFGCTDYRRSAEAIVVLGAKAYADGTPSQALYDRTLTGIALYHQGLAPALVMSGGGDEPQVMRRLAVARGVPDEAIVLDEAGVNTEATIANLRGRFARVLAVSHYYHNARIKMTAGRFGIECFTVPARMTRRLRAEPYYVARECAAFAKYYLLAG